MKDMREATGRRFRTKTQDWSCRLMSAPAAPTPSLPPSTTFPSPAGPCPANDSTGPPLDLYGSQLAGAHIQRQPRCPSQPGSQAGTALAPSTHNDAQMSGASSPLVTGQQLLQMACMAAFSLGASITPAGGVWSCAGHT